MKGDRGDVGPTGAQGMKGDRGDVGPTGAQGMKGDKGDVGPTGAQGMKGDKGDVGPTGAQGMKGDQGEQGPTGPPGTGGTGGSGVVYIFSSDQTVSSNRFLGQGNQAVDSAGGFTSVAQVMHKNATITGLVFSTKGHMEASNMVPPTATVYTRPKNTADTVAQRLVP